MRVVFSSTTRLVAVVVSCVVSTSAAATAQTVSPTTALQTATPPADGGPVKSLTVDEAVRLALEQNVNLHVERLAPQLADEAVNAARAAWTPTLNINSQFRDASQPPNSFLSGATDSVKTRQFSSNAAVESLLPWGSRYSVGMDSARSTSNSNFSNFKPELNGGLNLRFIQPLLRDRAIDNARHQLVVSKRNREISDVVLKGTVIGTVRTVKNAYWDLKYAVANLAVQKQSLDLARQTLKDNRTRVDVGTMAPIDIVEAESEVARNEEAVIIAEANIKQAEDSLRALILDPATPGFWTFTLDPVDTPKMSEAAIDIEAAVANAVANRTDILQARKNLENVTDSLKLYRNQLLPAVNLQADVNTIGLGGTQLLRDPSGKEFPPKVIGQIDRGYGRILGDAFGFKYPTWIVQLNVSYPLGRSPASVTLARTKLEKAQGELQLKSMELQVATQVRSVGRQVNTDLKRIEATRATRQLNERRLEAEQKKFAVGTSTSFLVFQAQRDLATARANELKAIVDYNKALVEFEAVQQTGGGVAVR